MPDSSENCCLILNLITLEQTKRGIFVLIFPFAIWKKKTVAEFHICDERDI